MATFNQSEKRDLSSLRKSQQLLHHTKTLQKNRIYQPFHFRQLATTHSTNDVHSNIQKMNKQGRRGMKSSMFLLCERKTNYNQSIIKCSM